MTTSINISFISSPCEYAGKGCKKDYRSSAYNNYCAECVDLDNDVNIFEVEASSISEAGDKAESIALEMGLQVNYLNIYEI